MSSPVDPVLEVEGGKTTINCKGQSQDSVHKPSLLMGKESQSENRTDIVRLPE